MLRFILSVQILPWTVYLVLLNDFATCLIKNSRQFAQCSYLSYIQGQNLIHQPYLQMHDITSFIPLLINDYQRRQQTWQLMCFVLNKWISYVRIPRQKRTTILPVLAIQNAGLYVPSIEKYFNCCIISQSDRLAHFCLTLEKRLEGKRVKNAWFKNFNRRFEAV